MIFQKSIQQFRVHFLFILTILWTTYIHAELHLNMQGYVEIPAEAVLDRVPAQPKKKWTMLVYIAADNDLYPFAYRNLAQMKQVGSNENFNIVVHLDIRHSGQPKVTKRLYIENNKIWQIGPDAVLDSGSDITLFDSVQWALNEYPSEHFALVLWNHGSGDLNPILRKTINPSQLFRYNAETALIDLDRSIGFIDFIDHLTAQSEATGTTNTAEQTNYAAATESSFDCINRGICFDETNGTYLDDAKLMRAFTKIVKEHGKKIDLIIFDACLMAGTGTTWIMSQFANYMVASEEVVPGSGYNYQLVLQPLADGTATPENLAKHIVQTFYTTYGHQTNDYTHSALKLQEFGAVSDNIDLLSELLIEALQDQKHNSVKQWIKKARSRQTCTYFDEPSYIDLWNFYENLLNSVNQITLNNKQHTNDMIEAITYTLQRGIELLRKLVIANTAGKNLAGAHGISIYFPEFQVAKQSYASYDTTEFARNNSWLQFLRQYFK